MLALRRWWRKQPPVSAIAAAWVGYKPPQDPGDLPPADTFDAIERAIAARAQLH